MEIDVEKYQKDLDSFVKNHNESVHVKREYRNTLISVVGVCFGVLVAFKDETSSLMSNVFYFAGLFCCAASLVLLVISAQGPIVAHKNKHDELVGKIEENLFGNPPQKQNKRNIKAYNNCETAGRYFFYVAIASFCVYSFLALFCN
jgi:hypothetical protein